MQRSALVVGASGIGGHATARELLANGWTVYGLARRPPTDLPGMIPVPADLMDPARLAAAFETAFDRGDDGPTHVFITTWMRQDSEAENIRVNAAMVRNLLDALAPRKQLRHVALVTGLKHYLGPFEAYASTGTRWGCAPARCSTPPVPARGACWVRRPDACCSTAAPPKASRLRCCPASSR